MLLQEETFYAIGFLNLIIMIYHIFFDRKTKDKQYLGTTFFDFCYIVRTSRFLIHTQNQKRDKNRINSVLVISVC